jgi:GNAT superfamily N-acetyltransferase
MADNDADYHLRPVGAGDLDLICRQRYQMFKDSGRSDDVLAPMAVGFRPWLEPRLADHSYFGWIAERDGEAVGGLGMMVIDWAPHPLHPTQAMRGYILNVFVEADHRGRGLAHTLMDRAMDEARQRGLAYVTLHASRMGRPIYEKLGWAQTTEMSFSLN